MSISGGPGLLLHVRVVGTRTEPVDPAEMAERIDAALVAVAGPEWREVTRALAHYCSRWMPKKQAEALSKEVVASFLAGDKPFDPTHPKTPALKDHLLRVARSMSTRRSQGGRRDHLGGYDAERAIDAQQVSEAATPEEALISREREAETMKLLQRMLARAEGAAKFLPRLLIEAHMRQANATKAAEAAGFSVREIANARRALKRFAEQAQKEIRTRASRLLS